MSSSGSFARGKASISMLCSARSRQNRLTHLLRAFATSSSRPRSCLYIRSGRILRYSLLRSMGGMMRLAYIHPGKESDKQVTPEFFKEMEGAIRNVVRPDTSFEIWGLPGNLPEEDEMAYWYVHPKIFSGMIANAKRAEKAGFDGVVIGCVGA